MTILFRFLSVFIFLFFVVEINAQQYKVLLKVEIENQAVDLDFKAPANSFFEGKFSFSNNYPNYFNKITPHKYVTDFVVNYASKQTDTLDISKGLVLFPVSIVSFSYKVHENFGDEIFLPTANYYRSDLILLSMPYTLGFFNEDIQQIVEISILENNSTHKVLATKSIQDWMQSPLVLSSKHNFSLSEKLDLNAYANKLPVSQDAFFDLLGKAVFTTQYFQITDNGLPKQLFFIFDTLESKSGAISLDNTAVFYFNEKSIKNLEYTVLKTVIHEILHWYLPLGTPESELKDFWISEASAEYLAIKSMLKAGIISEDNFFEAMQSKIVLSYKYKDLSLEKLSLDFKSNPYFYEAFYSKGVVVMWLLDNIMQQSGPFNLEKILLDDFKDATEEDLLNLYQAMADFEEDIVNKNSVIDFNKYLPYWGLLYEKQRPISYNTTQEIELKMIQDKIVVFNSAKVTVLQKNDVLLSVNRLKRIVDIDNLLNNSKVFEFKFIILRNGKKIRIEYTSPKQSKIIYDNISKITNATKEQKEAWQRYFN